MAPLHRFLALFMFFAAILTTQVPVLAAGDTDTDVNAAIEEALRQRMQPEHIASRIVRLVQSADYRTAEHALSDLLNSKPVDIDGERLLENVYLLLSLTRDVHVLDKWCEDSPSSHFPFMIRGMHYYEKARFLDGANQTLLLNEKQRQDFNQFLRKARSDLHKAHELNPRAPGPPAALTALSLQLKQPRSEMEQWFARAVAADPAWLGSYRAKLLYLAPWRYGSDQMMAQFAKQCSTDTSPENNTFIVTLDWIKLKSDELGTSPESIRFLTDPEIYALLSRGLDHYITAFPLSPRIETYRTVKELVAKQPYLSTAAFSETLRQAPENIEVLKGRIATYLASKQIREAETDIHTLELLEGPTPFSIVNRAAVSYRGHHDLDDVTRLYDQAIADETSSYRRKHYLFERAEINRNYGRYTLAIEDFTAAISEDILFEDSYLGRAKSHFAQGNLDAALADLIILKSSIRGKLATNARSLITTYMKSQRDKLASRNSAEPPLSPPQETARRAAQSPQQDKAAKKPADTSHREHLIRGLHRFYQQDYASARRDFYRTIASNPASAQAYFMLATIAEQVDFDHVKARVFYEQAYHLKPDQPDYLLGVSRSRIRDGEFSTALRDLSDHFDRISNSPVNRQSEAQLYFLRGLCLEELGLIPEALENMNKALRFDPQLRSAAMFIENHAAEHKTVKIAVRPIEYVSRDQKRHPPAKEPQQSP